MGCPREKRNRISGARGRRGNEQAAGVSLEDPQFADLAHSVSWSPRGPIQHEQGIASELPR